MYVKCLSAEDTGLMTICHGSSCVFRFGDRPHVQSTSMVHLPAYIGNKKIFINTDVVDHDIPLLLSHMSMKKADTQIDFRHDKVQALEELIKVYVTPSEHCILPLRQLNFS